MLELDATHVANPSDPTATSGRPFLLLTALLKDMSRIPIALGVLSTESKVHLKEFINAVVAKAMDDRTMRGLASQLGILLTMIDDNLSGLSLLSPSIFA